MRLLFIENEDSFSWNVIDALPFEREAITVVQGRDIQASKLRLADFDAVVIGPGPMDPVRAGLLEVVHRAAETKLPTLGVCLGHQAIGLAFGARLVQTLPAHGKTARADFAPSRCFAGEVGPRTVMRYHSLALTDVPSPLEVIARTGEGVVMAIEHQTLPLAGVQFHPDSYASERGGELFAAFFRSTAATR